jgi:hypothetical protein
MITRPVWGQSAAARYATSGDTFAGWNVSNWAGSSGARTMSAMPATSSVMRVRATGTIALTRTP